MKPVLIISTYPNKKSISKISNEFYLELFAQDFNFQFSILRPSNAYGPGQNYRNGLGVIPNFVKSIYSDRKITLFGENVIRDFVYIDDLVRAIVKSINSSSSGTFNVGSGEPTSIEFVVNFIEEVVCKEFIISNLGTIFWVNGIKIEFLSLLISTTNKSEA